jgi:hypothetical protein
MRAASDPLFRCREHAPAECRVRFDLAVLGEIHSDFPGGLSAIVILGSSPTRVTHLIRTRSDVDSSPHVYGIDNARFCYRQESQRQRGLV